MARHEERTIKKLVLTDGETAANDITVEAQAVATTTGTHDANIAIDIGGTTYYIMLTSAVT